MKKVMSFLILLSLFIFIPSVAAEEVSSDLAPNSKSAILLDASTKTTLFKKNEQEKLAPASMTKVMSMLLIMEAIDNGNLSLDDDVTISENAASMGGSQVYLQAGETYKVKELLKGIAVASGNDAVVAMAEKISGTVSDFVARMNERAKELGAVNTHFVNPHGLDAEDHYTTAYDMALMAFELLKHPTILEYTSIYEDYLQKNDGSSIWLVNTNKLVRFYDGVDGLKTGFTATAGYCLTATAKKNNLRLISVVMGAETSDKRSSDTTSLLNYGFNTYKTHVVLTTKDSLGVKRVENGVVEQADIVLTQDYVKLLKQTDAKPNYSFNVSVDSLVAPLKKGDIVGKVSVVDETGSVIDTLDVTLKEDIPKVNWWQAFLKNLKHLTAGQILIK